MPLTQAAGHLTPRLAAPQCPTLTWLTAPHQPVPKYLAEPLLAQPPTTPVVVGKVAVDMPVVVAADMPLAVAVKKAAVNITNP